MTPDQIEKAKKLLEKFDHLISLCDGLMGNEISIEVSGSDVLGTLNLEAEALRRISKPAWEEVVALTGRVLSELEDLGVDTSEQRLMYKYRSMWDRIPRNEQ